MTLQKRFRDASGQLTCKIEKIEQETAEEAGRYYKTGHNYLYAKDGEEYVYTETDGVLAHFHSWTGKHLFIPVESLGTFLPDVADPDLVLSEVID